jgi:hypothetical protein
MLTLFTLICLTVSFGLLLLRSALVLFHPDGLRFDLELDRRVERALAQLRAAVAGPAYRVRADAVMGETTR